MSDPIILRGYDDTWPAAFQQVATTIRRAFDAAELTIPRIDHIGSTAIPGIAGKPVIDIQISVIDLEPMTYRPALESLGYHWRAHNPEAHQTHVPRNQADGANPYPSASSRGLA